jgi:hypothetical protein
MDLSSIKIMGPLPTIVALTPKVGFSPETQFQQNYPEIESTQTIQMQIRDDNVMIFGRKYEIFFDRKIFNRYGNID